MSKIKRITVYKKRTNTKEVWFGADYSDDELVSEIRVAADDESELIASWSIEPKTDGVDGKYIFTIDDSDLPSDIPDKGYMDIKRISAGEPLAVHKGYIVVDFQEVVTA